MNKKQLRLEFKNRRNNLSLEMIDNYSLKIANLIIKLSNDLLVTSKNVDFSELCITSSAIVEKSNTEDVTAETIKAEGDKCPVCWKISKEKCVRHSN